MEHPTISRKALTIATDIINELLNCNISIFIGDSGEVQLVLYRDNSESFEFTIEDYSHITYVHELGDKEIKYLEDIDMDRAISEIDNAIE